MKEMKKIMETLENETLKFKNFTHLPKENFEKLSNFPPNFPLKQKTSQRKTQKNFLASQPCANFHDAN